MVEFHVKRCFVALPVDDVVRADLAEAVGTLAVEGMRRVPMHNWHVTLKFLGDVDDPQMPQLLDALRTATEDVPPFDLEIPRLGYLPNRRRPRILMARVDRPAPLLRLHEQIEEMTHAIGFQKEARAYNPHITLGRFRGSPRRPADLREAAPIETGFRADRVVLYQSILNPTGPEHVELASFALDRPYT